MRSYMMKDTSFARARKSIIVWLAILASAFITPAYAEQRQVYMDDMTWMEIRDRIQGGATTVIVPIGGVEQNGPHMTISKHNIIARYAAGEIAERVRQTLVAPLVPFSPSGRIDPPEGHMQFPGTISLSEDTFTRLLEDVAASLKQHGFRTICFIGDHGGSQVVQRHVANRLTSKWQSSGVRVMHVSDYYENNGQEQWAERIGTKTPNPGAHAGIIDTSELLAIDAVSVRSSQLGKRTDNDFKMTGATGDSTAASAEHGRRFLSLKIEAAVRQIDSGVYRAR